MKKIVFTAAVTAIVIVAFANSGSKYVSNPLYLQSLQQDYNSGNLDQLINKANLALSNNSKDIDSLLALATAYAMKGSIGFSEKENGDKAIEYADKILALDDRHSEAYRVKAYAYEIQELYEQAHQNYNKAIEFGPENFQALSNKGHSYDLQGDLQKAEEYYKKSLHVNPHGEHALLNLARLLIRQRQREEAKNLISTLENTSNSSRFKAEGYQLLAEIYRADADYDAAMDAIEKSLSYDSNVPQAWVTHGRLTARSIIGTTDKDERKRKLKEAENSAKRALSFNKNQATAYILLSDLMVYSGDQKQRAEYKELALKALDVDITLGQNEKNALRNYLTADIQIISASPTR